jgi:hypothetical protein
VSVVPGQTWVLATDANGSMVGLKLDNSLSTRERCLPDTAACKADMDFRDPVIMGRDPSLVGANLDIDPDDPSGPPAFRIASTILNGGGRFARPALWEQIGTQTGRRVRDSFMPGSGVLSESVMQRMYLIQLCEIPGTEDVNGSGWGEFGEANSDFFASGNCEPLDPGNGGGDEEEEDEEEARQASLVCDPGDSRGFCLGTDDVPAPLLSDATGR